ncbi:MAG: cytochrome c-type biogenesis protein CcmH [Rhodobacteraceae bacterium]|nr:cytochrome c-type biogenesis protein CcmH [Paracoccaceae bacterium]
MIRALLVVLAMWSASSAWALDPSEMLDDPALEARARALDHQLRCVVCQSETVASSNAQWALDARALVREQVEAGRTDAEIMAFFVTRYGEYVLMDPPKSGSSLILWAAGPIMLLIAGLLGWRYIRGRASPAEVSGLSDAEKQRLKDILDE